MVSLPPKTTPDQLPQTDDEDVAYLVIEYEPPTPPDISHLITEDETPVDNLLQEKLQRLLVQCLYHAFQPGQSFLAMADVGLFYGVHQPALVPDVMVSLGVKMPENWREKRNRSYFLWEFGKPPEMVIEIVSNRKGKELGQKRDRYAQIGVIYYVVFDPLQQLSAQVIQAYVLHGGEYEPLAEPWFPLLGLGLTLWTGQFEDMTSDLWLRWCDRQGAVLLTGTEAAEQERQRAIKAEARAARLAELLRSHGLLEEE